MTFDDLPERLFRHVELPEGWCEQMQELARRGPVVFVLRNLSLVDALAMNYLAQRAGLPACGFVNGLMPGILEPTTAAVTARLQDLARKRKPNERLARSIEQRTTSLLFLKRSPHLGDVVAGASGGRGLKEGEGLLSTLFELQRTSSAPIQLVPIVLLWSNSPATQGTQSLDLWLGPREWPSTLRTLGQIVSNYPNAELCQGAPVNLRTYLADQGPLPEATLIRRLTYLLLRRLERERRSATGPATIPPDRQRQRVLRSPQLRQVVRRMAGENAEDQRALLAQAEEMLKEMQATPNASAIRASRSMLNQIFGRMYTALDVDVSGLRRLRDCAKEGTLVLLPSHKSHMDYLVISYVFDKYHLGLPLIAAGDNLSFFPFGPIARRSGAFFIRRAFKGDRLYAAVVEAYVRRILHEGNSIELFLEGGRSRTGKLLPPQIGLLNIIVNAALAMEHRPIYFAPISIGYERLVEAESFQDELAGREKEREDAATLLKSTEALAGRYGRIDLQFGRPLSLTELRVELDLPPTGTLAPPKRRALVTRLANRAMDEINRVTEVTPGALSALALLSDTRRTTPHEALLQRCRKLLRVLQLENARIHPRLLSGNALREDAITEAMQLFIDAGLVTAHQPEVSVDKRARSTTAGPGRLYRAIEAKRGQLDVTKNHIVHFFFERGIVAIVALMGPVPLETEVATARVDELAAFFKHEFRFQAGLSKGALYTSIKCAMVDEGELLELPSGFDLGLGTPQWPALPSLKMYRDILRTFVEGYLVAARALGLLLRGPMAEKEWRRKATQVGERMYYADEISFRESISSALFKNAVLSFRDQGYVLINGGELSLPPSCCDEAAVKVLEHRIKHYLSDHFSGYDDLSAAAEA